MLYCYVSWAVALSLFSAVVYLLSVSLRSLKIGNHVSYHTCRYSSVVIVNAFEKKGKWQIKYSHLRQKGPKKTKPQIRFFLNQLTLVPILDSAIGGGKQPPKYCAENGNTLRKDSTGNGPDTLRSSLSDRTVSTMRDKIIDKSTCNFGISM